jgi:hypothetical protein
MLKYNAPVDLSKCDDLGDALGQHQILIYVYITNRNAIGLAREPAYTDKFCRLPQASCKIKPMLCSRASALTSVNNYESTIIMNQRIYHRLITIPIHKPM